MLKEAILYERLPDKSVRCKLCAHYCVVKDGKRGVCGVRKNEGGVLFSLVWSGANGLAIDPIEKKPFFHYKPGTSVLSFGTPGCNFRCLNCQNWSLSKNPIKDDYFGEALTPEIIVQTAIARNVGGIAYTYSEPTIFFEYARDVIKLAKRKAPYLFHVFVSNGYLSDEAIDLIEKEDLIDAINIDLKFADDEPYKRICGAKLAPVVENLKRFNELKDRIHLEIINLVIPGENDSEEALEKIVDIVYSINPEIPLHFNRFYPAYKMLDVPPTPLETLLKARQIALKRGLAHVYIGNVLAEGLEDTVCPNCGTVLIKRSGYRIIENKLIDSDKCPTCERKINIKL